MKKLNLYALIALLIVSTSLTAYALTPRHGRPLFGPEIRCQLTDTQFEIVQKEMRQMRGNGATRTETQAAVKAKLLSFGVDLPDGWQLRKPHHPPQMMRIMSQLSEEQRQVVEAKIEQMHENNATKAEIRTEVHKMLEGFGIPMPEGCRF